MKKTKWQYSGDVNMLDYGGKNIRHIGQRKYQIVEFINMDEACGRDNKKQPKYNVRLSLVDLDAIGECNLQSALECCGVHSDDLADLPDQAKAEACHSYGCHAPLESWNGNNAHKLLRQAYQTANELTGDSFTGWDCQASNSGAVAASKDDIIRFGLSQDDRDRFGLTTNFD